MSNDILRDFGTNAAFRVPELEVQLRPNSCTGYFDPSAMIFWPGRVHPWHDGLAFTNPRIEAAFAAIAECRPYIGGVDNDTLMLGCQDFPRSLPDGVACVCNPWEKKIKYRLIEPREVSLELDHAPVLDFAVPPHVCGWEPIGVVISKGKLVCTKIEIIDFSAAAKSIPSLRVLSKKDVKGLSVTFSSDRETFPASFVEKLALPGGTRLNNLSIGIGETITPLVDGITPMETIVPAAGQVVIYSGADQVSGRPVAIVREEDLDKLLVTCRKAFVRFIGAKALQSYTAQAVNHSGRSRRISGNYYVLVSDLAGLYPNTEEGRAKKTQKEQEMIASYRAKFG